MAITTNTSGSLARHRRRAGLFSFPDPVNEVSARVETPRVEVGKIEPVKSEPAKLEGASELRRSTD